ncbi:MAG: helix-turn-helix transcriptional regulator [Planctomycetota bacterium]
MAKKRVGRPRAVSGRRRGFALKFWRARRAKGLTQEQAASELGCALSTIATWETGKHEPRGMALELALKWIADAEA